MVPEMEEAIVEGKLIGDVALKISGATDGATGGAGGVNYQDGNRGG